MRHVVAWALLAAALLIAVPSAQSGRPGLEDVLSAAGEYVKGYEGMALVAQEEYTQLAALVRRNLQSDILFMKDDSFGWVEFRDVGLVNGAPVRDRQGRLLTLFTKPNPDRLAQASPARQPTRGIASSKSRPRRSSSADLLLGLAGQLSASAKIGACRSRSSTGSRLERRAATPEVFWPNRASTSSSATSTRNRRTGPFSRRTSMKSASSIS